MMLELRIHLRRCGDGIGTIVIDSYDAADPTVAMGGIECPVSFSERGAGIDAEVDELRAPPDGQWHPGDLIGFQVGGRFRSAENSGPVGSPWILHFGTTAVRRNRWKAPTNRSNWESAPMGDSSNVRSIADGLAKQIWSISGALDRFTFMYTIEENYERAAEAGVVELIFGDLYDVFRSSLFFGLERLVAESAGLLGPRHSLFQLAEQIGSELSEGDTEALASLKNEVEVFVTSHAAILETWDRELVFGSNEFHGTIQEFRRILQKIGAWYNGVVSRHLGFEESAFGEPNPEAAQGLALMLEGLSCAHWWTRFEREAGDSPGRAAFGAWADEEANPETVKALGTLHPLLFG